MKQSLGFELVLLRNMNDAYSNRVLKEIGIDWMEAQNIIRQSGIENSDIAHSTVSFYRQLLGPESGSKYIDAETNAKLAGSTAYFFLLNLWPHLFWVVHESRPGFCWEIGFQNQTELAFTNLEARAVRAGVWTLHSLQYLADSFEFHDGWDEKISVQFVFGEDRYLGTFVFGLLQDWHLLDSA